MKNVLILGANSSLGLELCEKYKNKGYTVYGMSTKILEENFSSYVDVITYEQVYSNIEFSDVVIVGSRVPSQGGTIENFIADNLKVAKKAVMQGWGARYIFISSYSVYDQTETILDLKTSYTCNDSYGISKLICEKYLQDNVGINNLLIMRIPVLLCYGVQNNFMSKLKKQIEINGTFTFSNVDSCVNTFFTADDYFKVIDTIKCGVVNCCTEPDWKISDLIDYALRKGLTDYKVVESLKPPQFVKQNLVKFSKTSEALINFIG